MEIKTIGVIGSGIMGRGIAHVAGMAGYKVVLQDVSEEALKRAMKITEQNLEIGITRNKVTQEEKKQTLENIRTTTRLEDMATVDFVIEAVPEDFDVKKDVYQVLDTVCRPDVIYATNTTSKSITALGATTTRPDRFIGMHFFNPVHIMKLIEIAKGMETSEETIRIAREVGDAFKKVVIVIKESPGFITSRIQAAIGNEAFHMLQEGIATAEEIDIACRVGLNHPMGPFEMVDFGGLETRLKSTEYLHQTLGEKFRPCPLLVQYVNAGRYGRKTGKGVYEYDEDGKKINK